MIKISREKGIIRYREIENDVKKKKKIAIEISRKRIAGERSRGETER